MRALKELPELKPAIESGALPVSSVSKVQTHFRKRAREPKGPGEKASAHPETRTEKLELFRAMENCTAREVDAKLAEFRGEKVKAKLVLEMDEELENLWKRVKDLAAHRSRGDEAAALKLLAREWLERNDPQEKEIRKEKAARAKKPVAEETHPGRPTDETRRAVPLTPRARGVGDSDFAKANSRSIPASLRRTIWRRDEGKCTRCGSRHALEIDHILPFAMGGKTHEENLRLVCRSCNGFLAVKSFGPRRNPAHEENPTP